MHLPKETERETPFRSYGAGTFHAGLDLLPAQDFGFNDVYVSGETGVKAKAFGFTTFTWKVLEGKIDIYKRQRPSTPKGQALTVDEGLTENLLSVDADIVYPEVSRDYVDKPLIWNGDANNQPAEADEQSAKHPLMAQSALAPQDGDDGDQESVKCTVTNEGIAAESGTLVFEDAITGKQLASVKVPTLNAHKTFEYTYKAPKGLFRTSGVEQIRMTVKGNTDDLASTDIACQESIVTWSPDGGFLGETYKVKGNTYKVTSNIKDTVTLVKAKKAKTVKVPATVVIGDKTYKVTSIGKKAFAKAKKKVKTVTIGKNVAKLAKGAFSKSAATKLIVKTKKLKKASVKGSLKGSKIKTVKVKVGSKKANKKYKKKYKKIFTKKNCGKKVKVQ